MVRGKTIGSEEDCGEMRAQVCGSPCLLPNGSHPWNHVLANRMLTLFRAWYSKYQVINLHWCKQLMVSTYPLPASKGGHVSYLCKMRSRERLLGSFWELFLFLKKEINGQGALSSVTSFPSYWYDREQQQQKKYTLQMAAKDRKILLLNSWRLPKQTCHQTPCKTSKTCLCSLSLSYLQQKTFLTTLCPN